MKWKLQTDQSTDKKRLYIQETTGTQLTTELIYTDKMGGKWWGFSDLFAVPYIRTAYAKQVSDLFTTGVTVEDLDKWDNEELKLLKSNDPEKYEKLYSLILERRKVRQSIVDPMKQHLALCTIYVLQDQERIDYYTLDQAGEKMQLWQLDKEATGFFLNWHTGHILKLTETFKGISQIALNKGQQV